MADHTWPVSVKGVLFAAGRVLLLQNDRNEWELAGGRLEPEESPEQCVIREFAEETGLEIQVDRLIDCWVYPVLADRRVLIVTFGCQPLPEIPALTISAEHRGGRFVDPIACGGYAMPEGYRRSINAWA